MNQMNAIRFSKYGTPDMLEYKAVERPNPTEGQVLMRVISASLNAYDWHMLTADPFLARMAFGLFKPKRQAMGADAAGVVEEVGPGVTRFKPGDAVFGDVTRSGCGTFAEYVCAGEEYLALKPANLSFDEAAAAPMAAVTALLTLRDAGRLQAGQAVAINGATGGVGTFMVQIAKFLDARVTAVCSPAKVELVRSLGADRVVDYTREDFTRGGETYDLIMGVNGYRPLADYARALKPGGTYVMAGGSNRQIFEALLLGPAYSAATGKRFTTMTAWPNRDAMELVARLMGEGSLKAVIDRCYPLSETAEAMRYLGQGHARGKIVIHVGQN